MKADDKQTSLFITLGRYNNTDAIRWIHDHDHDHVNDVTSDTQNGSHALHITASIGRISLTQEILSLGVLDVNATNANGYTPLDLSALY